MSIYFERLQTMTNALILYKVEYKNESEAINYLVDIFEESPEVCRAVVIMANVNKQISLDGAVYTKLFVGNPGEYILDKHIWGLKENEVEV